MKIKRVPRIENIYKNVGKVYNFYRFAGMPYDGFVADGTWNPWYLGGDYIRRINLKNRLEYHQIEFAVEAPIWQLQIIIKRLFEGKITFEG